MKEKYETLDEYLDALDRIKEQVAEQTQGMNFEQIKNYFATAKTILQQKTGQRLRVRRARRKGSTAKR